MTKEKATIGDWIFRGAVWVVTGIVCAAVLKLTGYLIFLAIMSAVMLWSFLEDKKPEQEVFFGEYPSG